MNSNSLTLGLNYNKTTNKAKSLISFECTVGDVVAKNALANKLAKTHSKKPNPSHPGEYLKARQAAESSHRSQKTKAAERGKGRKEKRQLLFHLPDVLWRTKNIPET